MRLSPAALAHWYAGSGSVVSGGYALRLATHGFTRPALAPLAARLNTQGLVARVDPKLPVLRFTANRQAFLELVRPHLTGCGLRLKCKDNKPAKIVLAPKRAGVAAHAPPRKLTRAEFEDVLMALVRGESQHSIARRTGLSQPRVCWMKKRYLKNVVKCPPP